MKIKLLKENVAKDKNQNFILIDLNKDGKIDSDEAEKIYFLDVSHSNIKYLDGIKFFKNLNYLNCSFNEINQMDEINSLNKLVELEIEHNAIEIFSIDKLPLQSIIAENSGIKKISLKNCILLYTVLFADNQIEDFDIENSYAISTISAENNKINKLDCTKFPLLETLMIENNDLKVINLSKCTYFKDLYVDNNKIEKIIFSKNNTFLKNILASNNQIKELLLPESSRLENLDLNSNLISTLDTTGNPNLLNLYIDNNKLNILKISSTKIKNISFVSNPLTSICIDSKIEYQINNALSDANIKNCKITTTCNIPEAEEEIKVYRTTLKFDKSKK